MYMESDGSRKTIGDVDVLYHDGLYHLFHLVLPNHDYIAHATSPDGMTWTRVENALFLGHPGTWDDSMLWTMHVSEDPTQPGWWRMFYTGISRADQGRRQRLGLAISRDLYTWEKAPVSWNAGNPRPQGRRENGNRSDSISAPIDPDSCFPLEADPQHYEADLSEGRQWVSWRDPFYYREGQRGWLLCSGRVNQGPVVRRGCVAALEETQPGCFTCLPPLHHPGLYDDVEVPNLIKIEEEYYLIGSIREDAKIRYWHTQRIGQPWRSYADNVLLARGNYAGRLCRDPQGYLIWNFFTEDISQRDNRNLLPPPKRLSRGDDGTLQVTTFEKLAERVIEEVPLDSLCPLRPTENETCLVADRHIRLQGCSGFQIFLFQPDLSSFCLRGSLQLDGAGKCGIVFRLDPKTQDGYYLSLDLLKGIAQLRDWGTNHQQWGEHMMRFRPLQANYWRCNQAGQVRFQLYALGSYIELSIDGRVVLSLADQAYSQGAVGFYVESAEVEVRDVQLQKLRSPTQSDEHLVIG